jgi:hypothetical protein
MLYLGTMDKCEHVVREIHGYLGLTFGKDAKWFCGWYAGDQDSGFASSAISREELISWLEETLEAVRNSDPVVV